MNPIIITYFSQTPEARIFNQMKAGLWDLWRAMYSNQFTSKFNYMSWFKCISRLPKLINPHYMCKQSYQHYFNEDTHRHQLGVNTYSSFFRSWMCTESELIYIRCRSFSTCEPGYVFQIWIYFGRENSTGIIHSTNAFLQVWKMKD